MQQDYYHSADSQSAMADLQHNLFACMHIMKDFTCLLWRYCVNFVQGLMDVWSLLPGLLGACV